MTYGILGEDASDTETMCVIVRRLTSDSVRRTLRLHVRSFGGCGELIKKGRQMVGTLQQLGCDRIIVCCDADHPDPSGRRQTLLERVAAPSATVALIVPVQELEAWILADIDAVLKVIPSWKPSQVKSNPEAIASPKEHLRRLSEQGRNRPLYDHVIHNPRIVEHLDLDLVSKRCPSFRPLQQFIATAPATSDAASGPVAKGKGRRKS